MRTPHPALVVFAAVSAFAIIGALSLVPGDMRPHTGFPGEVEHFVAYGLTAATLCILSRRGSMHRALVAGLCLYAGVLETLQIWIPGRHAQFIGFAASASGAVSGYILVSMVLYFCRQHAGKLM